MSIRDRSKDFKIEPLTWDILDTDLENVGEWKEMDDGDTEEESITTNEFINKLNQISFNWVVNPAIPDIIFLRYWSFYPSVNNRSMTNVPYHINTLPNKLAILGAVNTYFKEDITGKIDQEYDRLLRSGDNLLETDPLAMFLTLPSYERSFFGLAYVSPGVYDVMLDDF